ncbi:MAG: DUF4175 domain-containing protein, partial [Sphingomonadaceae bacterium]|nr:DUF4175 domain-containing protein [Sphingomonadaceae bacterium]
MNGDALFSTWRRAARARSLLSDLLLGLPLTLLLAAVAWRLFGTPAAIAIALLGISVVLAIAAARVRRYDERWLMRRLDTLRADTEDSSALLLADEAGLNPLQQLQRARLERRLADEDGAGLRPAWRPRRIGIAWLVGAVGILIAVLLPSSVEQPALALAQEGIVVAPGVPKLVAQSLRIVPPAYTGLPARTEAKLDARAPQGSRLAWRLRFDPQPASAALILHDGQRTSLRRVGDEWVAERRLDRSVLYRVIPEGGEGPPLPPLHRLDATPDTPPRLRVLAPERSVTILAAGQRGWTLVFEATDDHGVAAAG